MDARAPTWVTTVRLLAGVNEFEATAWVAELIRAADQHEVDREAWIDGWTILVAMGLGDLTDGVDRVVPPLAACATYARTFGMPFADVALALEDIMLGDFDRARGIGLTVDARGPVIRVGLGSLSVMTSRTPERILAAWVRLAATIAARGAA